MEATTTITLYRESDNLIIAEVKVGEKYYIPTDRSVQVFEGTIEQLKEQKPNLKEQDESTID